MELYKSVQQNYCSGKPGCHLRTSRKIASGILSIWNYPFDANRWPQLLNIAVCISEARICLGHDKTNHYEARAVLTFVAVDQQISFPELQVSLPQLRNIIDDRISSFKDAIDQAIDICLEALAFLKLILLPNE